MLLWGCVLSMQGDVFCNMQACLVYLELILIAQYIFQIPTHLHCKAVSDTTQVCDSCVRACMRPCMHVSVHACVCRPCPCSLSRNSLFDQQLRDAATQATQALHVSN